LSGKKIEQRKMKMIGKLMNEIETKIWKAYVDFFRGMDILSVQQRENETIVTIKFSAQMPHEDHEEWAQSIIERDLKDTVIRMRKYWSGRSAIVVATVEASGSLVMAEKLAARDAKLQARMAERRAA